jgi:hypothetical protein
MAFPTEPLIATPYAVPTVDPTVFPVPTWANAASPGDIVDPGASKRAVGWEKASPSVDYGEAPPFPWENHERYLNGQWSSYFKAVADYLKSGALAPSVAILSSNTAHTINMGSSDRMQFMVGDNHYYNYTGYPIWDPGPQHLVVPYAGLCRCTLSFSLQTVGSNTTPFHILVFIRKNGSSSLCQQSFMTLDTDLNFISVNMSCLFEVVAGDALDIVIVNLSATNNIQYQQDIPICSFSFSRTTPF